ncbi:MAG: tRNA preQ1(34) S-adenosylmethionine ribosyltransferase-isomerase QueA [Methylophilaceae bacterium]|nr:tRNA preQ1(34) S-adenosylmethionine ribosyltransferase-isomerase QueA [Methylophilaceae bacterium]MDG1821329.1 tRNA preQ1(34) S-adenosylmethionine ribosyltransferase-isomerase QueA [Methylophilaceae bacterium]
MKTEDFDFDLPQHLIAQHPTKERNASRLLYLDGANTEPSDHTFLELPTFLAKNDLLIFNDTRVIKARLFGQKATGGNIEILVERIINDHEVYAMVRSSRSPKAGSTMTLAGAFDVEMLGREDDLFHLKFLSQTSVVDLLEQYGCLPLPPYIEHQADSTDEDRYQTIYAKHAGAVAAPTAGLHFDESMLNQLKENGIRIAYITLHVGAGTFKPVSVDHIAEHKMHSEVYHIPTETIALINQTRASGGKVTAIGTTVMRALESAAQLGELKAGSQETNIFITPGFTFKVIDRMLTNFHLPKSTLLMLVSAFTGFEAIKHAYAHAINKEYRFFSYGDAMLLEKKS